ncbi:MAG: hypothetical protein HY749_24805 [Gammaproteobacteria bacterium]|nr:hypothetical protein [Gammaproteobacteria bacterium]
MHEPLVHARTAPCARPAPSTSYRSSPVVELVDYFNHRLANQWPTGKRDADPFFLRGDRVCARIAGKTLHSQFRTLADPEGGARPPALLARLVGGDTDGSVLPAAHFLARFGATPTIVAVDRACRVLHMLNHLALGHDAVDLWLHVSPRHVLGVAAGHGQFFEDVLQRCGLGPDRIALVVPFLSRARPEFPRYARGLANYRRRGYRLAIDLREAWPVEAAASLRALAPDWLRLPYERFLELGAELPDVPVLLRGLPGAVPVWQRQRQGVIWQELAMPA